MKPITIISSSNNNKKASNYNQNKHEIVQEADVPGLLRSHGENGY